LIEARVARQPIGDPQRLVRQFGRRWLYHGIAVWLD
jgi:hypothetical protein